jgi:hypothetical protein
LKRLNKLRKIYCLKNKEKISAKHKDYLLKNKERIAEQRKEYERKNRDRLRARRYRYAKTYHGKNRVKDREYFSKYYLTNKMYKAEWAKSYYTKNEEKIRQRQRGYYACNAKKISEYQKRWKREHPGVLWERIKKDPHKKLRHELSSAICNRLKHRKVTKAGKSILDFLPYTIDQLITHLEKQFKPGMSWKNHCFRGWHIDHKIADSKFNYKSVTDSEFRKCWALDNLQPLWWRENLTKSNH